MKTTESHFCLFMQPGERDYRYTLALKKRISFCVPLAPPMMPFYFVIVKKINAKANMGPKDATYLMVLDCQPHSEEHVTLTLKFLQNLLKIRG